MSGNSHGLGVGVAGGVGVELGVLVGVGLDVGVALGLGDATGLGDGDGAGVVLGVALPMRGRSCCEPENGARSLGEDTTSAATAAAAASAVRPTGTTRPARPAGRSPVFCGERAYARRPGVRMMPSDARLAHGALE